MDTMTEPRFRRPTRVEMEARLDAILDIVEEIEPCSVRQAFYQTVVRGLMDNTEADYDKVQRAILLLRRAGRMPFRATPTPSLMAGRCSACRRLRR
jgi:hypothetical protein